MKMGLRVKACHKARSRWRKYMFSISFEVAETAPSLFEQCPSFVAKTAVALLLIPPMHPSWIWLTPLLVVVILVCIFAAIAWELVAFAANAEEASDE